MILLYFQKIRAEPNIYTKFLRNNSLTLKKFTHLNTGPEETGH